MSKRYIVTMDFYVYADDDNSAIQEAENIANDRRVKYDDRSQITSIEEQSFGSLKTRKVK